MCKVELPQEESGRVLAVGHKVRYHGEECVIKGIRVWHDMGTLLDPPWRGKPVFDVQGQGWGAANIPLTELELWLPEPEQ